MAMTSGDLKVAKSQSSHGAAVNNTNNRTAQQTQYSLNNNRSAMNVLRSNIIQQNQQNALILNDSKSASSSKALGGGVGVGIEPRSSNSKPSNLIHRNLKMAAMQYQGAGSG